jgi:hypothetical protein
MLIFSDLPHDLSLNDHEKTNAHAKAIARPDCT